MESNDFDRLKSALDADLRQFIAAHRTLTNVYALAVAFDPEQGSMVFAIADEPGIERVLEERYPDVVPAWENGLWGVRWNPSDFPHVGEPDAAAEPLGRYAELAAHGDGSDVLRRRFVDVVFDAVEGIRHAFEQLDTVADFVVFVSAFDQDEDGRKAWMRRTIDDERFARLFPSIVAFENFVSNKAEARPAEQARFWADAMENLAQRTPTPEARALMKMGRTSFDAEDALVALGAVARPRLLEIVERHALRPQMTEPGTEERARFGVYAPSSNLTTSAAHALAEIGGLTDAELRRLRDVLAELVADYPDEGVAGINAAVLARVLHRLDPDRFPQPDIGDGDNRLRNADRF